MNPAEKIKEWSGRSGEFYHDVRGELKKVVWPSRQEVFGTTVVVLVAVAFFATYLFIVDSFLGLSIQRVLAYFGGAGG